MRQVILQVWLERSPAWAWRPFFAWRRKIVRDGRVFRIVRAGPIILAWR